MVWSLVLALGLIWSLQHAWVSDDIFITFRYCDNVLAGHGPVYNVGERSEGYTHFLWFCLLTLGRAVGVEPGLLGKYLSIPAFVATWILLVSLSARLFPGRGGIWGAPVAALAWAAHEDVRLFASGGLETAAFLFAMLLGFTIVCTSSHPRKSMLAAWAYAIATLLRPEGLLFSGLAGLFLFWRSRWSWRQALQFGLVWLALVAPLFLFRLSYYGYPFPNPYYAKSGSLANWPQGLVYMWTYFGSYFVLLAAVLALFPLLRTALRRGAGGALAAAAPAMGLAFVCASASVFYVTRVGGDFMFARFYLPATPFLLLLCEYLVQHLPRPGWRVGGAVFVVGLVLFGGVRKQWLFSDKRHVRGIVDEPQYYPDRRLDDIRGMADGIDRCLGDTGAVLLVQGGQASLAYYAKFPVAVERYGLTDAHIAHSPAPPIRGRPGHEKLADAQYIYDRRVNLRIHYRPVRSLSQYVQIGLPWKNGIVFGEIIVYDRELMEALKLCPGARFLDFPRWLERDYLPNIDRRLPIQMARDYDDFKRFYFKWNPDPEGLQEKLENELARRGVEPLPEQALRPDYFQDTGRPTGD
ncbi:MAG: hypothetical protein JSW67_15045 [Candidatus Latescibacterota bacterium]|nr:MAG: hypothetical protein JSW67_15045 [Candidatus Latescibacterota bacterium]